MWGNGNGQSINAWRDKWLDESIKLIDYVEHIPLSYSKLQLQI